MNSSGKTEFSKVHSRSSFETSATRTSTEKQNSKPRKRTNLLFIIFTLILLVASGVGVYFALKARNSAEGDKEKTTINIFIPLVDDEQPENSPIPPRIADAILAFSKDNNIERGTNPEKAQIVVELTSTSEEIEGNLDYYQFLVLSKPWNRLTDYSELSTNCDPANPTANAPKGTIYASEKINFTFLGTSIFGQQIAPEPLTEGADLSNAYLVNTLRELDSTRIAVTTDGKSPYDKSSWTNKDYPWVIHIKISGPQDILVNLDQYLTDTKILEENDYLKEYPAPEEFVTILKTGTTVSGGPGWTLCEKKYGRIDYPIDDVKDEMVSADIAIISNEGSFVDGCTQGAGTTAFCGKPSYLQNLLAAGVDISSLTGNHMCDYGRSVFTQMLDTYTQNNIKYYAAGKNLTEAWTPLIYPTSAGTIAFIGVNKMGPDGVLATESLTGAAYYDQARLKQAIETAKTQSDYVWVDTQLWPEYGTTPGGDQVSVSQEAINYGADIVTGVSSHELQGAANYNGKLVFYGLGNFFFDQMLELESRQGIALRAYMYDGKVRSIEILPTMMFNNCQPRFLEGSEKERLLNYFLDISTL